LLYIIVLNNDIIIMDKGVDMYEQESIRM